jgi:tripartite-type tricarboxylate transporter receptor subunit TctC
MSGPDRIRRSLAAGAVAWLCVPVLVRAQGSDAWPSKPIRLVVPYPAGGVVDVHARALAQRVAADLGQPVVVDNRPGANANVGAEAVARAAADGYTLLVSAPFVVNNPILEQALRWTPRDLVPIARFAAAPGFLVVAADSPIRDFAEFLERARKAAPPLRYGDAGAGTTASVSLEIIRREARFDVLPVQYKGLPQVIPDLINGGLDFTFLPLTLAKPQVEAGRIRALANIGNRRSAALPGIPTVAELGVPRATVLSWYGLHAPAGTPPAVLARLEQATKLATASEEVRSRFSAAGGEEAFMGQADFVAFLESDRERMQGLAGASAR